MGVDVNAMSIYGFKIDWNDKLHQKIEELEHWREDDPPILVDGMSGEYMILGPVLFDSGSHRMGFDKDDYKEYTYSEMMDRLVVWSMKFVEKFPEFEGLIADVQPKYITLMYYS